MRPRTPRLVYVTVLGAVVLVGCGAPPGRSPSAGSPGAAANPENAQPRTRTVTIAIGAEVNSLATKFETGNTFASEFHFMTNSPLALRNAQGVASPLLAADLPSRDNGTWTVNPDGTMATTWRIKPNARWHDGQPVISKDFVFAHRVYLDDAMPVRDRLPEQFMQRIESLDDKTFVIHWKTPYPRAGELASRELEALPDHVMGSLYAAGDSEAFVNQPFWSSTDYVGNGPFRLMQWDPGAQLTYRAFNDYFMGPPKVEEVVFRIISDTNTVVANVLGATVDTTVGITLGQKAGVTVREQWTQTGDGKVVITPVRFRYVQIQFDPAYSQQPGLADLRIRRAIVHGIDRATLAEIVTEGTSPPADIPMSPNDPRYPAADAAVTKYPYDPNRALARLQEAGWTRRGDALVNAGGQPFALDIRTTAGADNESEQNIIAADLNKLGIQTSQAVVPQSRIRDSEFRIKFPGLYTTAQSIDVPGTLRVAISDQCPDPQRRYTGSNRGCWRNADFDRLHLVAASSLDARERDDAVIGALRILTDDVGIIGLSYNSENLAVRKGLVGPGPRWPAQVGNTWNIHEWRWE